MLQYVWQVSDVRTFDSSSKLGVELTRAFAIPFQHPCKPVFLFLSSPPLSLGRSAPQALTAGFPQTHTISKMIVVLKKVPQGYRV